jgi:hypothetical protein
MAKSIRLLNVDVIMNTAGQVIAGGVNTHEADGHSSAGNNTFMVYGGYSTLTTVQYLSYQSGSSASSFSATKTAFETTADGDGSNLYRLFGRADTNGSSLNKQNSISAVNFSSQSVSESSASLSNGGQSALAAGGDGSQTLVGGGRTDWSTGSTAVHKYLFSDESLSENFATTGFAGRHIDGASNGSDVIFFGGASNANNYKMSIGTGGTATGHGALHTNAWGNEACSNGTYAMYVGQYNNIDNMLFGFDTGSILHRWNGAPNPATGYHSAASNGTTVIAAGGENSSGQSTAINYQSFDHNENFTSWGTTLLSAIQDAGAASGNA